MLGAESNIKVRKGFLQHCTSHRGPSLIDPSLFIQQYICTVNRTKSIQDQHTYLQISILLKDMAISPKTTHQKPANSRWLFNGVWEKWGGGRGQFNLGKAQKEARGQSNAPAALLLWNTGAFTWWTNSNTMALYPCALSCHLSTLYILQNDPLFNVMFSLKMKQVLLLKQILIKTMTVIWSCNE